MKQLEGERQDFYVGIKGVICNTDGFILMIKDLRNMWELPGGRIDQGFAFEDTFRKELSEELPGATMVRFGETVHEAISERTVEGGRHLMLIFKIVEVTMPQIIQLSDEHSAHDWVSPEAQGTYDIYNSDRQAIINTFDRMTS